MVASPPLYNWFPTKNMAAGNTKNPWKFWPSQWNFLIYFSISSYPLENSLLIFNLSSGIYFPLLTIPWKFHTFLLSLFIPTLWNFHRFALKIGPYHGNFCIFGSPLFFWGGGALLEILMSSIGGGASWFKNAMCKWIPNIGSANNMQTCQHETKWDSNSPRIIPALLTGKPGNACNYGPFITAAVQTISHMLYTQKLFCQIPATLNYI